MIVSYYERDVFAERLNAAINEAGGKSHISKVSGVSLAAVKRMTKADGEPSLEKAIELAEASGKSLEWLIYGLESGTVLPPKLNPYVKFENLHSAIWSTLQPLVAQGHVRIAPGLNPIMLTASVARTLENLENSDINDPGLVGVLVVDDEETASKALVNILDEKGVTDQELADKMKVDVSLIETLKTDDLEWTTELALGVAKALDVSPLKFLMPGQDDPQGDKFFELYGSLSDADKLKAKRALRSLLDNSDPDDEPQQ